MITLRPFGPSVTFTASARMSTPRNMRLRASSPKRTSLAAICLFLILVSRGFGERWCVFDDAEQIALLHDEEFLAVELDLGAGPLAEQHPVAGFHVQIDDLALLVAGAGTGGHDLALHRLLLHRIGDDDPAGGLLERRDAADHDTVVQGAEFHVGS